MMKLTCERCGSQAVMSNGYCMKCRFWNKPQVDPQQERQELQRRAEEERKAGLEAEHQAKLSELETILELAEAGNLADATRRLIAVDDSDPAIKTRKLEVQAELWRLKGVPEKQLETMELLMGLQPFGNDTLELYYRIGCLYQEGKSHAKAFGIFNRFVDNQFDWFKEDILSRWRELKDQGVSPVSPISSNATSRVLVGAMDRTVESLRGWIDRANGTRNYFAENILLNSDTFTELERVEKSFTDEPDIVQIVEVHSAGLVASGFSGYSVDREQLVISHDATGANENVLAIVIRPEADGPMRSQYGSVHIAARIIPEGRSAVSISFYEYFQPADPGLFSGQQPDIRDFNDQVYRAVQRLQQPDTARMVLLRSHRQEFVKTVEQLLDQSSRSGSDLMF